MNTDAPTKRPGGRSARVRAAVHGAAVALVAERGADQVTLPAVAERAGVNSSTIYRRWGTLAALLADIAQHRGESGAPPLVGDLRTDLENQAVWTLAELSRPGGIAFFRAEVAPDVDDRHEGLRECLRRVGERFRPVLDTARERGDTPPPRRWSRCWTESSRRSISGWSSRFRGRTRRTSANLSGVRRGTRTWGLTLGRPVPGRPVSSLFDGPPPLRRSPLRGPLPAARLGTAMRTSRR